jgi:hypothetical protein
MYKHTRNFSNRISPRCWHSAETAVDVERESEFLHVCGFEVGFLGAGNEGAETGGREIVSQSDICWFRRL